MQLSIVLNQRTWQGAGDLDDCWVLSLLQAVLAVTPWVLLPGVTAVREAAGDPDDGDKDGGTVREIRRAILKLWPEYKNRLTVMERAPFAELQAEVRKGRPASIAVMSDKLPPALRYGLNTATAHQVTIAMPRAGHLVFANPLAPMGSRWDVINWADILPAMRAYSARGAYAVVLPRDVDMWAYAPGADSAVRPPDPAELEAARRAGFTDAKAKASAIASQAATDVAAIAPAA